MEENNSQEQVVKEKKPFYKRWWFITIVVLLVLGAVFGDSDSEDKTEPIKEVASEKVSEEKKSEKKEETEEKEVKENDEENKESRYFSFNSKVAKEYQENLTGFSEQSNKASEDISLMSNDEWITETATIAAKINDTSQEVIDYNDTDVPEKLKEYHKFLVEAAEKYMSAMFIYAEGIDNLDPDKIIESSEIINEANSAVNKANEILSEK